MKPHSNRWRQSLDTSSCQTRRLLGQVELSKQRGLSFFNRFEVIPCYRPDSRSFGDSFRVSDTVLIVENGQDAQVEGQCAEGEPGRHPQPAGNQFERGAGERAAPGRCDRNHERAAAVAERRGEDVRAAVDGFPLAERGEGRVDRRERNRQNRRAAPHGPEQKHPERGRGRLPQLVAVRRRDLRESSRTGCADAAAGADERVRRLGRLDAGDRPVGGARRPAGPNGRHILAGPEPGLEPVREHVGRTQALQPNEHSAELHPVFGLQRVWHRHW